jgi:hypothetical protein
MKIRAATVSTTTLDDQPKNITFGFRRGIAEFEHIIRATTSFPFSALLRAIFLVVRSQIL